MNVDLAYIKNLAEKATPGPWCTCLTAEQIMGRKHPDWGCIYANVEMDGNIIEGCHLAAVNSNLMSKEERDTAWKEFFKTGKEVNPGLMGINAEYIAAANPSVMLALISEIEQLRHEKDFYTRAMADYLQVAKIAWGGEIPSPLPGHTSSEEKMIEQFEYLNCPSCGGSGHVGDCSMAIQNLKCDLANAQSKAESLEKEADWLAKHCEGKDQCPYMAFQWGDPPDNKRPDWCVCTDTQEDGFDCDEDPVECWRKAARKAMENNNA